MSKKKVKKNEGWYGKLCQMMSNHNIVRKWLIGIVMLFLCGIFNSFFSGFYDSCSIVIGNASVGFFRKFVDLYYVASARAELTDGSNEITWFVYCFLIAAMWILRDVFKWISVDKSKSILQKAVDIGTAIDSRGKESKMEEKEGCGVSDLKKINRKLQDLCEKDVIQYTKQHRRMTWGILGMTVLSIFALSLTRFAYATLKDYRYSVAVIRPYITDQEYYMLNRQWVLMKSKMDFQNVVKTMAEYAKRAEASAEQSKSPKDHNEMTGQEQTKIK